MAIIKCKMCGGDLNLAAGSGIAECEFCGSVQTIRHLDDNGNCSDACEQCNVNDW